MTPCPFISGLPFPSARRHPCPPRLWLALAIALLCPPLQADEASGVAEANSQSTAPAEMPWLSGGIGDEALREMRKVAGNYNVHVLFSNVQGAYLAGIPFRVTRADGRDVHAGISNGPLLYLKLAPGNYRFAAEIDGTWQNRRLQAGSVRSPAKLSFVAKGG